MDFKQENPFTTRIIYEPQVLEDDSFGIVADIDPIVSNHYLFYVKEQHPSIADTDITAATAFLEDQFVSHVERPYAYFERGRASFCTSMQGVLHGHGHLVPVFSNNLSGLFPYGEEQCFSSLKEAYDAISNKGQYLLWGNLGGAFFLIQNVEEMPKRTIRHTIRKFSNC